MIKVEINHHFYVSENGQVHIRPQQDKIVLVASKSLALFSKETICSFTLEELELLVKELKEWKELKEKGDST